MKARGRRSSAFIVFECLKPRWNTKHEFLKLLLQQKKISLNYHLNKVSQFNYYIWDVKCAWCTWSYHLTAALWQFLNIHQLMSGAWQDGKRVHCKYLSVVPYKALEKLSKALYGTTGSTYSARAFRPVMLPSCLSVLSEHVAAECRFRPPKTSEEEEKCVFSAIPR